MATLDKEALSVCLLLVFSGALPEDGRTTEAIQNTLVPSWFSKWRAGDYNSFVHLTTIKSLVTFSLEQRLDPCP